MAKKLLGLLLVVAMLASCLVACGDDEKKDDNAKAPEQSTSVDESSEESASSEADSSEEDGEVTFDSLTDNREKLVYLSGITEGNFKLDDKVYDVLGVDGVELIVPEIKDDGVIKYAFNAQLTELMVGDTDMLEEQFGGPLGIGFNALTEDGLVNFDANASVSGMNVALDVKADENGILITSPFVFKKPVYITSEFVAGLMAENEPSEEITNTLASLVAKLAEFGDNDVFEAYLGAKAVELIPEDAVQASKVTLGDVETDCIVLSLNGKQLSDILGSLRRSLGEDPAFKLATAGIIKDIIKLIELGVFSDGGDIAVPSDAEVYDAIFDFTDDIAEEFKDNEDFSLVVKRYFLNGIDARFDIEVVDGDTSTLMCCWDIYADDSNDYGLELKADGDTMLSLKGGSKGDKAEFSLNVNDYSYSVEMDENGEYQEEEVLETVMSFSVKRDGKTCNMEANIAEDAKLVYEYKDGGFTAAITSGEEVVNVNGIVTENEDGVVCNATVEKDGQGIEITFTSKTVEEETKLSQNVEINIELEIDGTTATATAVLSTEIDTDSKETVDAPKPGENDFVVESVEDAEKLEENLTEIITQLMGQEGNSAEDSGEIEL